MHIRQAGSCTIVVCAAAANSRHFARSLSDILPEYQRMIADAGALPFLVGLLWRQGSSSNHRIANGVVRRAANVITNLALRTGGVDFF